MVQIWANELLWINCPFGMILDVVARLRDTPAAEALLVVPFWDAQPWFPMLGDLMDSWFELDPADDLVFPGITGSIEPLGSPHWRIVVCHVPRRDYPTK
jgi:hypothetical protein